MDSTEAGFFIFERRVGAVEIAQHDFFKWGDVMLQTAGVAPLAGCRLEKNILWLCTSTQSGAEAIISRPVSLMSRSARSVLFAFVFLQARLSRLLQDFSHLVGIPVIILY